MKLSALTLAALATLLAATSCQDTIDEIRSSKSITGSLTPGKVLSGVAVASSAKADFSGSYAESDRKLTYLLAYGGLTGSIKSAAFYYGDSRHRSSAPVSGLPISTTSLSTGQFTETTTLTQQQADSLYAGRLYFSLSTDKNPGGELRTNLEVK